MLPALVRQLAPLGICAAAALLAPQAAAGASKVSLIGGADEARQVQLQQTDDGSAATLEGDLRLSVENVGSTPVAMRVRYAEDGDRGTRRVVDDSEVVAFSDGRAHDHRFHLKPMRLRRMLLHFALPASSSPRELDGTLYLETFFAGHARPTERIALPVTGVVRPHDDVAFDPKSVQLQTTRLCPILCGSHESEGIELVGAGAGRLVDDLDAARRAEASKTLTGEGGKTAKVKVSGIAPSATDPGVVDATVELDNEPPPGGYKGNVTLSQLAGKTPTLDVQVNSRVWVVWAIALVFAGGLLAGWTLYQLELGDRRRRLRPALKSAVDLYRNRRSRNDLPGGQHVIWTLDRVITGDLEVDREWTYYSDLDTANRIYTASLWARNDQDLDEVQKAVLELLLTVKRWDLALTLVEQLRRVAEVPHPDRGDASWPETNVALDTNMLLKSARHTPPDEATRQKLTDRVQRQIRWHEGVGLLWDLKDRRVKDPDDEVKRQARAIDIDEWLGKVAPIVTRTQDQQDADEVVLDEKYVRLQRLRPEEEEKVLPLQPAARVAELRQQVGALEEQASTPAPALSPLALNRVLGDSEVGPGNLIERVTAAASQRRRFLQKRLWRDWLVSLVIMLITSIVYVLTIYDNTWGSLTDLATAATAGFAGQLVVRWVALPIYRSIRMRVGAVAQEAQAAAKT